MTQNVDCGTVVSRLLAADDILILCHKNPDGDTIGSGTALCLALQQLGKNAAVLCSDPIPAMYSYMPITVFDGSFRPAFVVAVDVAGIQLFGERNNIQEYAEHVDLCIDHHGSNSGYAYETLVDDGAAAAAELLTTLIPEMGAKITPEIASCLYTRGDRYGVLPVQQHNGGDPPRGGRSDRGRCRCGDAQRTTVREPLPRPRYRGAHGAGKSGVLLR